MVAYVAASPSPPGGGSAAGASTGGGGAPVARASTSTRGICGNTINVVFPVVSLNSLAGKYGFAPTYEFGEQKKAIKFYVGQVNKHGGINGKKINAIIATFTPANDSRACGPCARTGPRAARPPSPSSTASGTWTGTNQLCVTQEGHTPLISAWSTVSTWTTKGAPYLWWTGPADTVVLQATVNWGLSAGLLGGSHKVGVVAGTRASDQAALKSPGARPASGPG